MRVIICPKNEIVSVLPLSRMARTTPPVERCTLPLSQWGEKDGGQNLIRDVKVVPCDEATNRMPSHSTSVWWGASNHWSSLLVLAQDCRRPRNCVKLMSSKVLP